MKLVLRQYLASLREREELDALLPDLLSELGLNVFSRPARGTRQDGVDVAAIGSLAGEPEAVYLCSIKSGNLTRSTWNGDSPQTLRQSLEQITDAFIPNRLPPEHSDKPIKIAIVIGGDVQEALRAELSGYIKTHSTDRITFVEWNGDRLAEMISAGLLSEELVPASARSDLRKSLALIDEPDAAFGHYSRLIRSLTPEPNCSDTRRLTRLRQQSLCIWILYGWSRDTDNLEAAYRAAELTLLLVWHGLGPDHLADGAASRSRQQVFMSVGQAYESIAFEYLHTNVLPLADKKHALSVAVRSESSVDVKLRLFDVLSRMALSGLWLHWTITMRVAGSDDDELETALLEKRAKVLEAIKATVNNNHTLLLPVTDDQAIDICLAMQCLATEEQNEPFVRSWIRATARKAQNALRMNGPYPCVFRDYADLLDHPQKADADYREEATSASILYPYLALWAALLGEQDGFQVLAAIQAEELPHCTYQFWYPDETTEDHLYTDAEGHGATLANVSLADGPTALVKQAMEECRHSDEFSELSAIKTGWWPVALVACRHYRYPIPLHFLQAFLPDDPKDSG